MPMDPHERRTRYGEALSVRELAGLLRGENPSEVDSWVDNNVRDLDQARALFKTILKYLVARGL